MKLVYLASPYSGKDENEIWHNVIKAHQKAAEVWQAGFVCISPCSNTAFFGGDYDLYLKGDMEIIKRCDAVLLNDGWENSKGCQMERSFAESMGIPVYEDIDHLQKDM